MTDQELIESTAKIMNQFADRAIEQFLPLPLAVHVVGLLQLTLRHPTLGESSQKLARYVADQLIARIEALSPELARFCRLGYDTRYDDKI